MFRQYDLRSDDDFMTCWLEDDARIRVGSLVALKGNEGKWWEIKRVYRTALSSPPERRWKVGGLL